jgi:hypothetical protein
MEICSWSEIESRYAGACVVLGNGFSISIDERFDGDFLTDQAIIENSSFSDHEVVASVLKAAGSRGIESAMGDLVTSRAVVAAIDPESEVLKRLAFVESAVRASLLRAIRKIHPEHDDVIDELKRRANALSHFSAVFTTNYDVLLYWMIMAGGLADKDQQRPRFVDLFWGKDHDFDPLSVSPHDGQVPVYYLRGALHIVTDLSGRTRKRRATSGNLVTSLDDLTPARELVIVTEGSPQEKVEAIRRSAYLFECLQSLERQSHAVVIGHSLSSVDEHLSRAIADRAEAIAVGVIDSRDCHRIRTHLTNWNDKVTIDFFDARTHPLCGA